MIATMTTTSKAKGRMIHLDINTTFLSLVNIRMTTTAVLIHEKLDQIQEVELDLAPHVNEAHILLERHPTFIGQWPEIDVVIMKSEIGEIPNENNLPEPFSNEDVLGPILLIKNG